MNREAVIRKLEEWFDNQSVEITPELLAGAYAALCAQPSEKLGPDADRGIYSKYKVTHADGRALDGDCFVLRPDRDPAAEAALRAYAASTPNKALAADILQWVGQPAPLTLEELRGMDGEPVYVTRISGAKIRMWVIACPNEYGLTQARTADSQFMAWSTYGRIWLAFRSKPKEEV